MLGVIIGVVSAIGLFTFFTHDPVAVRQHKEKKKKEKEQEKAWKEKF